MSLLRRRGRRSGAAVVDTLVGDGTRALCDQASRCSSVHWRLASLFHAKVDRTLSRFSASCRQCSNRNWLMIVASPPTSSDGSSALAAMVCSPRLVRSSCADQSFMGPDAWPLGAARHRPHPRWRAERGGVALDLQTGCRCSAEQRQPEVRGTRWISRVLTSATMGRRRRHGPIGRRHVRDIRANETKKRRSMDRDLAHAFWRMIEAR